MLLATVVHDNRNNNLVHNQVHSDCFEAGLHSACLPYRGQLLRGERLLEHRRRFTLCQGGFRRELARATGAVRSAATGTG